MLISMAAMLMMVVPMLASPGRIGLFEERCKAVS